MRHTHKEWVAILDDAAREWVKSTGRACVCCGKRKRELQCGHLFSRATYSTRWDKMNLHRQCRGCNNLHEYDPGPMTLYFLKTFGQIAYEELHDRYYGHSRYWSQDDFEFVLAYLEQPDREALLLPEKET